MSKQLFHSITSWTLQILHISHGHLRASLSPFFIAKLSTLKDYSCKSDHALINTQPATCFVTPWIKGKWIPCLRGSQPGFQPRTYHQGWPRAGSPSFQWFLAPHAHQTPPQTRSKAPPPIWGFFFQKPGGIKISISLSTPWCLSHCLEANDRLLLQASLASPV